MAVPVLVHLVRRASALLGEGYDAEIVELHHDAKADAPSGTALATAERHSRESCVNPAPKFSSIRGAKASAATCSEHPF
mgnify:CR=1 FL=1